MGYHFHASKGIITMPYPQRVCVVMINILQASKGETGIAKATCALYSLFL